MGHIGIFTAFTWRERVKNEFTETLETFLQNYNFSLALFSNSSLCSFFLAGEPARVCWFTRGINATEVNMLMQWLMHMHLPVCIHQRKGKEQSHTVAQNDIVGLTWN